MNTQGTPRKPLSASEVCQSLDSSKYRAQCKSTIRNGRYSSSAIKACLTNNKYVDYSLTVCMGSIKNKTYTKKELDLCLQKKKHLLNKCLGVSGTPMESLEIDQENSNSVD